MNREDGYESRYMTNNKRMHHKQNVKKPGKTVDQHIADTRLQDHWAKAHSKSYMKDRKDIVYHLNMLNNAKKKAVSIGLILGLIFLKLLCSWLGFVPPLMNSVMVFIIAASFGTVMVYMLLIWKKWTIRNSCMEFKRDWAILESLNDPSPSKSSIEQELRRKAEQVSEFQRLEEFRRSRTAKRKFTNFHRAMLRFGLCEEDHGLYYPKKATFHDLEKIPD